MMSTKTEPTSPPNQNLRRSTRHKTKISKELNDLSLQIKTESIASSQFAKLPIASIETVSMAISTKHEVTGSDQAIFFEPSTDEASSEDSELIILDNKELMIKTEINEDILVIDSKPGNLDSEKEKTLASLHDELSCSICFELYDETLRIPTNLFPCGHVFCHQCLKKIPKKICSTCKVNYTQTSVNWSLKNLVSRSDPSVYSSKIKELVGQNIVQNFSCLNETAFKKCKSFIENISAKMIDKIEEINQRNESYKKAFAHELNMLDEHINSIYKENSTICSKATKKINAWTVQANRKNSNETKLKNTYQDVQNEISMLKEKSLYLESKDINKIRTADIDLSEIFVKKFAEDAAKFLDKNVLEMSFQNLDLNRNTEVNESEKKKPIQNEIETSYEKCPSFIIDKIQIIKRLLNRFYYQSKNTSNFSVYERRNAQIEINHMKNNLRKIELQTTVIMRKNFDSVAGKDIMFDMNKRFNELYLIFRNSVPTLKEFYEKALVINDQFLNKLLASSDLLAKKNNEALSSAPQFDFEHGKTKN